MPLLRRSKIYWPPMEAGLIKYARAATILPTSGPPSEKNFWPEWERDEELAKERAAVGRSDISTKHDTETSRLARTDEDVERLFEDLLAAWKRDTMRVSDAVAVLMHPAHYGIIGLGPQVLPHILRDLVEGGGPWFVALQAITQENPTSPQHAKNARLMRDDWIAWGKAHGYIGS